MTSLACHGIGEVFFGAKEDGSVYLYEKIRFGRFKKLFSHAEGVSIVSRCFDDKSQLLSSLDSSSRVRIHRLLRRPENLEFGEPIFDHRAGVAVDQLLFNEGHARILVCSAIDDTL